MMSMSIESWSGKGIEGKSINWMFFFLINFFKVERNEILIGKFMISVFFVLFIILICNKVFCFLKKEKCFFLYDGKKEIRVWEYVYMIYLDLFWNRLIFDIESKCVRLRNVLRK